MSQIHLARMYGLTEGCQIEFKHTNGLFRYTGRLLNTGDLFQFTLKNVNPEDSEIAIGKEGVFDVQSILDTKIKVSIFDVVLHPYPDMGVITADLRIISAQPAHRAQPAHPQAATNIIERLSSDDKASLLFEYAEGKKQRLARDFERAGFRDFGLKTGARFCFRKEGGVFVGNVPRHEQLKFTFTEIVYDNGGNHHYENLDVREPDMGWITVLMFTGQKVSGLLEREQQKLYINRPSGRIYVDFMLHLSASFGHGIYI